MELTNQFEVEVPVDEAWRILTDIEPIAPCMPGAQLTEVEGEEYRGTVKVKVGPITAQYRGVATFTELDATNHRAVLLAEGRDTRGQGNAKATVIAELTPAGPEGASTAVSIATDLAVTGKVAQFGRGVMADVSVKLLGQFVACLSDRVLSGPADDDAVTDAPGTAAADAQAAAATDAEPTDPTGPAGAPAHDGVGPQPASSVRRIDAPEAEPVDLLDAAGGAMAKRAVPALAGLSLLAVLLWLWLWRSRRR